MGSGPFSFWEKEKAPGFKRKNSREDMALSGSRREKMLNRRENGLPKNPIPGAFNHGEGVISMAEKTEPKKEVHHKEAKPAEHKPQAGAQQKQQRPQAAGQGQQEERSDIRGIVRIAGRDLRGHVELAKALKFVKGVGSNYGDVVSTIAANDLKVPPTAQVGSLTEPQLERIEYILTHPTEFGVPKYMLNRQNDFLTGTNRHIIGTDLVFTVKQDIEHEKDIMTWRGYRHAYGQKVRGQHTRTGGRTGMTVGVIRKSIIAKAGAGAVTAATGAQAAGAAGAAAPAGGAAKGAAPAAAGGAAKGPAAATPTAKPAAPAKK